jgi:hypothetical protein
MHELEPMLTRYGYNVKALSELLHIRQPEVHSFLHGQLPPGRTEGLHRQLLAAGIPLGDHLPLGSRELATGRTKRLNAVCSTLVSSDHFMRAESEVIKL